LFLFLVFALINCFSFNDSTQIMINSTQLNQFHLNSQLQQLQAAARLALRLKAPQRTESFDFLNFCLKMYEKG